jgi:enamine deaminase RidA (YjgF/YER057c/UK114 family)
LLGGWRTASLSYINSGVFMSKINRIETDDFWADSTIIEAGNFVYTSYCMKNEGQPIENQINGAFDILEERLQKIGLTLDSVVQMDCLFANIQDLNFLPAVIKQRFTNGKYPARKAYETKFIREGILFQIDAVAFREK